MSDSENQDYPDILEQEKQQIEKSDITSEMHSSFLSYAMSVIVSRALPDVRDGLKPVHRRILFAMHGLKIFHNKPYLKCARVVGDVLGKYHPHGDSSVYDALVRMSQVFSMRYPIVDGQGNFGSIDGDGAAAMRYTESRMKQYAEQLLVDIDKGTVDFVPNYDNKELEPVVLPSRIPHLLVNGSSGIAVGMATFIVPHNLGEVMAGLQAMIKNPAISVDQLMQFIPGPDFPLGAEIHGISGIRSSYLTGRGSIKVRSKTQIEYFDKGSLKGKSRIVVSEIPYMVNKAMLVESIAQLVQDKKIDGISDIRDESSKDGIRVVIECKKSESPQVILNHLYKLTRLQTSFGINSVALVKGVPKLLSLKSMLTEFYQFRRQVVLRRSAYLLAQAKDRQLFLLAIKIALDDIDNVVNIIRNAKDTQSASQKLIDQYQLLEKQAKAILEMRLSRLTSMERSKIVEEIAEIQIKIEDLNSILVNPDRVTQIVLEECEQISQQFSDPRRTVIYSSEAEDITLQSLVDDVSVVVIVSEGGYIKRTTTSEIQSQKRGGKGRSGIVMADNDKILQVFECTNHQDLLCFTNLGRVYSLKVYLTPEAVLRSRGKHFANLIPLEADEQVLTVMPVGSYDQDMYVTTLTKLGMVKRTSLQFYSSIRKSGIIGMGLNKDDSLVGVKFSKDSDYLLIAGSSGNVVKFKANEVRPLSRSAKGVMGMKLDRSMAKEQFAISLEVVSGDYSDLDSLLSVSEKGYGKRSQIDSYRITKRKSKGVIAQKVTEKTGALMGVYKIDYNDDVVLITSKGTMLRMNIANTAVLGRNTQGVRLMKVAKDEVIQSVCVINIPNDMIQPSDSNDIHTDNHQSLENTEQKTDPKKDQDLSTDSDNSNNDL